ncbi:hypothetical protein BC936DRAFT_149134 [Jimgerdemannia flammicorona]|uniref:Uncharacterized protein n=1 Tax=Jimgerdemannia flammicorona TaxID=994334 RepID=A0A433D1H2_9FUNG|nr:hypothetical protein BC936DRAFT_149134 [Jimgerdemannia flammicorona]
MQVYQVATVLRRYAQRYPRRLFQWPSSMHRRPQPGGEVVHEMWMGARTAVVRACECRCTPKGLMRQDPVFFFSFKTLTCYSPVNKFQNDIIELHTLNGRTFAM